MSSKKQTAVEWLYSELSKNNISNDTIKSRIYKESEILNQAKAMEKEQIIEAYYIGADEESDRHGAMYQTKEDGIHYYFSTYGS
jgi:hypothetical protein